MDVTIGYVARRLGAAAFFDCIDRTGHRRVEMLQVCSAENERHDDAVAITVFYPTPCLVHVYPCRTTKDMVRLRSPQAKSTKFGI
jgi:hypothetical protein